MNFDVVERQLKIVLPSHYKAAITKYGPKLLALYLAKDADDDCPDSSCFVTTETFCHENDYHRYEGEDDVLPESLRNWWQTYFIIGFDGGTSYELLRLDGTRGVCSFTTDSSEPVLETDYPFLSMIEDKLNDLQSDD